MKKNIIWLTISFSIAIIIGVIGFFLSEIIKKPAEIKDSEAKYITTLKKAPKDNAPLNHNPLDVISYILWKVENTNSFMVTTTGEAKASIATQKIANERIVIGKKAMVSTISSGLINTAKQKYYANNKVLIREYEKLDGINVTWKNTEPECISYEEMISKMGWLPWQANGYIICNDTYLNKDNIKIESLNNDLYKVSFDLNPDGDYAPFWYRREILSTSNSTMIPRFEKIHIDFTFDKEYRLIYQDFKESYYVKSVGITALTESTMRDEFKYDNIEFNPNYLSYFDNYKDMIPKEYDGEKLLSDDNATILVSSLQNGKDDLLLDLNIDINSSKLEGNALINISDLKNIKVMIKINDLLEMEYIDNNIYLNLLNLKLKGSKDDIKNIINKININTSNIDINSILDIINNGELIENGNNRKISFKLDILGININVLADIEKNEDSYILNSLNISLDVLNNNINLSIKKGNKTFTNKDYTDYYEINKIDESVYNLINALIATTAFKDFEISGNINMNISFLGFELNAILSVNAKIKVENGKPIIHINFDMDKMDQLLKSLVKTNKLDIYYKDKYIYIHKVESTTLDVYELKIDYHTFLGNIKYYLVEFGMGLTPGLIDGFINNEKKTIDLSKVLNDYSYSDNKNNIKLDLKELLSNDNFGILDLTLVTSNVDNKLSLAGIENLNVSILGLVTVKIDSLSLANINNGKITNVDMTDLESYINSYTKDIDKEYKNNEFYKNVNHKITFVLYDKNVVSNAEANTDIVYPLVEEIMIDGKAYVFEGWYKDRNYTIKYTNTKATEDITLYAKYIIKQ